MSATELVARLPGAKQSGQGSWRAPCPYHGGTNRYALSIREKPDGVVLVKCFHGCAVHDIVHAVGLELHHLFPERPANDHAIRGERIPFLGIEVLRALASEVVLIVLQVAAVARGEVPSEAERQRTLLAAQRLLTALDASIPHKDRRAEYRAAVRFAGPT